MITDTYYVRFRTIMAWRTLWFGINEIIDAEMFSAFTANFMIASAWYFAATFLFCADFHAITTAWDAAAVFEFCAMITYWNRVKHGRYCYHIVTSIWLIFKWLKQNRYMEPCQFHWVISPWYSLLNQCGAPTRSL